MAIQEKIGRYQDNTDMNDCVIKKDISESIKSCVAVIYVKERNGDAFFDFDAYNRIVLLQAILISYGE